MNLGQAIKLCRASRGLKQMELAEKAEISVSYLSLLERNQRDPNMTTVESIARSLDIPLVLLVFLAEPDNTRLDSDVREKLSHAAMNNLKQVTP
jgi:transcriptional regulator with XRE-family HTH domain